MKQRERQMGKEELQLKAVYNRLEKLSQHLEKKLALVPKDKHDIYLESSAKIVKKLLNIHQPEEIQNAGLISRVAAVRYTLESLISTRLLLREAGYAYKLYFSIFTHQEIQIQSSIDRINEELKLLDILAKKETAGAIRLAKAVSKAEERGEAFDSKKFGKRFIRSINRTDKIKNESITIWSHGAEETGYEYQAAGIRKHIVPAYLERQKFIRDLKDRYARQISKDPLFNLFFRVNGQSSKVFKILKDERKWEEKAKITGLEKEYAFIYRYTSSILHFTSYSIWTGHELAPDESSMFSRITYEYLRNIIQCIKEIDKGIDGFVFNNDKNSPQWINFKLYAKEKRGKANRTSAAVDENRS
jgi:hypothetical protein